jgi:predicted Zn-dependent protease
MQPVCGFGVPPSLFKPAGAFGLRIASRSPCVLVDNLSSYDCFHGRLASRTEGCVLKYFLPFALARLARNTLFLGALGVWPAMHHAQAADPLAQLGHGQDMSIGTEKALGQRMAREIYRDPDYIDDPVIMAYVQRIWQPLLAAAQRRGDISPEQLQLPWEILIGADRSINAFALPGAYFGLHLGLLSIVNTRDELASVLAHEIAHVSQRHIARQISKQNMQTPWIVGAMILGALAASKNPEAANAVIAGSQAMSLQAQLNFSRDMEREADRIGLGILQEAGMDVRGFTGMFEKLQNANRFNDNSNFPYLRTHPLTTERLSQMQSRLHMLSLPPPAPPALAQQAEHALIAARARLLSDLSADKLRTELSQAAAALRTGLAPSATAAQRIRHIAQLYGGALAALKTRDHRTALRYAQSAREALTDKNFESLDSMEYAQSAIELMVIEIALATPNASSLSEGGLEAAAALHRLRSLPRQKYARSTLLAWAQLAVQPTLLTDPAQERRLVQDALQDQLAEQPRDALVWHALAAVYNAQGQILRSLRADAESRVAQFDYGAGLDRLMAAQQWARSNPVSHIDASIIDTRAREVQALVHELQNLRDKP